MKPAIAFVALGLVLAGCATQPARTTYTTTPPASTVYTPSTVYVPGTATVPSSTVYVPGTAYPSASPSTTYVTQSGPSSVLVYSSQTDCMRLRGFWNATNGVCQVPVQ